MGNKRVRNTLAKLASIGNCFTLTLQLIEHGVCYMVRFHDNVGQCLLVCYWWQIRNHINFALYGMETSTDQVFSSAIIGSSTAKQKSRLSQFSQYREERYFANVCVQLLLYINVHFCVIWITSSIVTLYYQYWNLSTIHRVLSILSLVIAAPIECLRLYLGYSGNLLDKIPDFAGFWILSVFIQTPLQIYLMTSEQILKYRTSTVLQAIQCLLLLLQIISSFTAIRRASRFRRQQFQAEKASYDMTSLERDKLWAVIFPL